MLSLSELVGGQQPEEAGRVVPRPRVRTCSNCYDLDPRNARHEFDDEWCCSNCGKRSQFHVEFYDCEGCGERRSDRYVRNRMKPALNRFDKPCHCNLTDEEQAELMKDRAEVERKRAEERRRQQKLQQLKTDADDCWKQSGYECSIPKAHQLPMCRFCTRFRSSSTYRQSKHYKPEFDEIPLEDKAV